jgi:hypothetical protein
MLELESATQTTVDAPKSARLGAMRNWQRNLEALAGTQAELAGSLAPMDAGIEWVFGRDGSLTALEDQKWWGGCSVPLKAAEELLRTLEITAATACFLAPFHSAQIEIALRRLEPEQAVVALLPRFDDLRFILHCQDFSGDISAHRLWFTAGDQWPRDMLELFRSNRGLAIPQQFIRTILLSDETSTNLISTAQKIFSEEVNHRTLAISELRKTRSRQHVNKRKRITLAAPMRFRLWDDAGGILRRTIADDSTFDWTVIDFDDPLHASPSALAHAAVESDAILAANLTRAHCAQFLHPEIPLISWLTKHTIPAFETAGAHDMLLLCDDYSLDLAKKSGWPADRLAVASWPAIARSSESKTISIIADTRPIDPSPPFELSSHQLLWDLIRAELQNNPAIVAGDLMPYLHSRMKRLGVAEQGLDQRRFVEDLIIPAWQQSVASHLLNSKLPLRLFGQGWADIPTFAPHAGGTIQQREQLTHAISTSAAMIHIWPSSLPHPIDTAGPPVIRLTSRGLAGLIADSRLALAGRLKPAPPAADFLDKVSIARILRVILAC